MGQPFGQITHIDLNRVHDAVDCTAVGVIAHFAFARVVEVDGIKRVRIANRRSGGRGHLLQNDDGVRVVGIGAGSGGCLIILPAETPTQPIAGNAMPDSRIVRILNTHPRALAIVWNAGAGEFS